MSEQTADAVTGRVMRLETSVLWLMLLAGPVLRQISFRGLNGVPFSVPSMLSSIKSPSKSGRMVEFPLLAMPGVPGFNQNVTSTSQEPHIATSRACSASGGGVAFLADGAANPTVAVAETIVIAATSESMKERCGRVIAGNSTSCQTTTPAFSLRVTSRGARLAIRSESRPPQSRADDGPVSFTRLAEP